MSLPERLNEQFSLPEQLLFSSGYGGLTRAVIDNDMGRAEVYLHGAHVISFVPAGQQDLLWLSDRALFEPGKAIRGGIPVIWPWFGPHADGKRPQHGFARTACWSVSHSQSLQSGQTRLCLQLEMLPQYRELWPHEAELELRVDVGQDLQLALHCRNTGDEPFEMGAALHSYFHVEDIGRVHVSGLEGVDYIDQLDGNRRKQQVGDVVFSGEVDRIYENTESDCLIHDPASGRTIRVSKSGSRSTVVWNPWADKARAMADFPDQGYRHMLCIETANAGADSRKLEPGEIHRLGQTVSLE